MTENITDFLVAITSPLAKWSEASSLHELTAL